MRGGVRGGLLVVGRTARARQGGLVGVGYLYIYVYVYHMYHNGADFYTDRFSSELLSRCPIGGSFVPGFVAA